jgi:hypothetical protein
LASMNSIVDLGYTAVDLISFSFWALNKNS